MEVFVGDFICDVNQRALRSSKDELHYRISFTSNAPLAIDGVALAGLAHHLGLTQAEVAAVLDTEAFPPQLTPPGQALRPKMGAQWLCRPAVAALLALREAKLNGAAQ